MPLFNFRCENCECTIEKFQKGEDLPELICPECDGVEFKKVFSKWNNRKQREARELYNEKIVPDAKRIMREMKSGNNKHFLDVYGEK